MYQPKKHVFADEATRRISNKPAKGEPILFRTGPPPRSESFRASRGKMYYTTESKEWETLVKRQPVDTFSNRRTISNSRSMSMALLISRHLQTEHGLLFRYLPTTLAKPRQPKEAKARAPRLGFADSEEMPLVMPPQVLFDAFQDTERTGHLPPELRDGSMPLYMSLNRKFLDQYHHKRTSSTRRVYNKDPRSTAAKPGQISEVLEASRSRSFTTPDDAWPPRAASAAEGMFGSPAQTDDMVPDALSPLSTQQLSSGAGGGSPVEPRGVTGVLPEWQIYRSTTKGFPYWYNRITGESRWLPPDQGTSMNKTQSALLASDRSWFSYQPGYYKESQVESTGRSTYDVMVSHQKPDFQLQERATHRKSLQRRIARTQVQEEQTMRWFTSFPPGGATGWSDKLLRVIADKCYEHSGPDFALRTAFFKMDRDKSGYIDMENLKEVLEGWIGFKLSEENMNFLLQKFKCNERGHLRYEDFISAIDDRLHPLGGTCNLNTGSAENYSKAKEPLISHRVERRI